MRKSPTLAASDVFNSGALVTLAPHRAALQLFEHIQVYPLVSTEQSASSRAVEALKVELGRHHRHHRHHQHVSVFLRFHLKFVGRNFKASICLRFCSVFDIPPLLEFLHMLAHMTFCVKRLSKASNIYET